MDPVKNFAYSTVATAPSPATSGLSLTVASGEGANFPTTPFDATIWPSGSQPTVTNAEIVRVSAISGDVLTIARAKQSSSARTVIVGDQIAATITAKTVTGLLDNEFISSDDQMVRANGQVVIEDYYEIGSNFVTELAATALLAVETDSDETIGFNAGVDPYGGYLEILTTA